MAYYDHGLLHTTTRFVDLKPKNELSRLCEVLVSIKPIRSGMFTL